MNEKSIGKGGFRPGAGRKRKLVGRLLPVSIDMTDEMYLALDAIAKKRRMTFQKMMREISAQCIERYQYLINGDKNVK